MTNLQKCSSVDRLFLYRWCWWLLSIGLNVEVREQNKHKDVLYESTEEHELGECAVLVQQRQAKVEHQNEELDLQRMDGFDQDHKKCHNDLPTALA